MTVYSWKYEIIPIIPLFVNILQMQGLDDIQLLRRETRITQPVTKMIINDRKSSYELFSLENTVVFSSYYHSIYSSLKRTRSAR